MDNGVKKVSPGTPSVKKSVMADDAYLADDLRVDVNASVKDIKRLGPAT
jgi:hypothetical protein